jgi:hypothetical protein
MAGSHARHQQSEIAKKKQHDAVFFVKQAPRASADPGSPLSLTEPVNSGAVPFLIAGIHYSFGLCPFPPALDLRPRYPI